MRKSKIVSISLPIQIDEQLTTVMKRSHQSKSEVIKNILHEYMTSDTQSVRSSENAYESPNLSLSYVLKLYYELLSKQHRQTLVVALAIISSNGNVLIGKRGANDPHVTHLSWAFPGAEVLSLDFSGELTKIAKAETGLDVKVMKLIHTRLHPDNMSKKVDVVALYFHCLVTGGSEQPGQYNQEIPIVELKWVQPTSVFRYFTTSTADEVVRFLNIIETSNS